MDPTIVAGMGPSQKVTIPLMIELAEFAVEPTPISQYLQVSGVLVIDKGNGEYIPTPKKTSAPPMKPRGIAIGAPVGQLLYF